MKEQFSKEDMSFLNNATLVNKEIGEDENEPTSYLITPYFINELILKSDILKIEEIINEKFGNRVDKSETNNNNNTYQINEKNKNFSINLNCEYWNEFNIIKKNNLIEKCFYVIEEGNHQKCFKFENISENKFVKRYIIPKEITKLNEQRVKSKI